MTVPLYNLTDTWNASGTVFNAIQMNVTDTGHAAASTLLNLQIGGTAKLTVDPAGSIASQGGVSVATANLFTVSNVLIGVDIARSLATGAGSSMYCGGVFGAANLSSATGGGFWVGNLGTYAFSSTANPTTEGARDLAFFRDASASAVALANIATTTNATTLRVYNTTDNVGTNTAPTNYERGVFDWTTTSNVLTIGTQKGGTGSTRTVQWVVGGNITDNLGTAPVTDTASTYTVAATDKYLIFNGAGSITVTLPSAATSTGRELWLKTIAAFTVVSASSNVVPIGSATAGTAILPATVGTAVTLVSDGTNWITIK